ncbi:MAG TPA: metal-dependent hydrolase [Nitrososphaerales archaeon]|nr:metal-dependent hydrolase [Nitrososphaerales archaeon]
MEGSNLRQKRLFQVAALSVFYSSISFLWSTIGFASPTPAIHYHEYALSSLATEILGHALFGVAAGVGTGRVDLALLCGADAVLIDSDHLLASLNFPVLGRLSHSLPFTLVISLVLLAVPQRFVPRRTLVLVTTSSILSHLSYDVLAGNGQFPLLAPISFQSIGFPDFSWPVLELAAASVSSLALKWREKSLS